MDSLVHVMRQNSARFLLNETIDSVCTFKNNMGKEKVQVELQSGKKVICFFLNLRRKFEILFRNIWRIMNFD